MNSPSWFAERLPFLQSLSEERTAMVDRMHQGTFSSLEHYQQVMLLEAGIIGVVIPILHTQGAAFVNPWFLTRAVIWIGISMMTGILIAGVSRWTLVYLNTVVYKHFAHQHELLAAAEDEDGAREAIAASATVYEPTARRLRKILYAGVIGDVVFYGGLLRGVAYVVEAFIF